jgi:DNA polymerase-3 subunit gamma/tau
MFENIIAQSAASQLCADFRSRRLAPSMLFYGPAASGKGSSALELARALSCEGDAAWNCACPACARHRYIMHSDLLCLGKRAFSSEIAAARAAYVREPLASSTAIFFIRSVRKLMARFSPALWEDDSKLGKFRPVLETLEEALAEFESRSSAASGAAPAANLDLSALGKLGESIVKNAQKLEADGISDSIPVAQIRRTAYWARLAPAGKRKILLIENAGRMQESARNSLLKILEEPPATVTIILCAERRQLIMPTLLSRLRPYRFLKRSREKELEVIRRVFRDTAGHEKISGLAAYLDSFLPVSDESLYPLSAFFIASAARAAALALRKSGGDIPAELNALGVYCAPIADAAGFKKAQDAAEACNIILEKSAGFENLSFSRFIKNNLDLVSLATQTAGVSSRSLMYNDIWRKYSVEAESAVSIYNQNPALVLESLFYRLKKAMSE